MLVRNDKFNIYIYNNFDAAVVLYNTHDMRTVPSVRLDINVKKKMSDKEV